MSKAKVGGKARDGGNSKERADRAGRAASRTGRWQDAGALVLLLLFALPSLLYPLGVDQGVFSYVGREVAETGIPYGTAWDVKPPGVFYIYAIGWLANIDFQLAPRLLELLGAMATGVLLIAICRRLGAPRAGAYAVFFFGLLYYLQFNFWNTAQAEGFAAPFTALTIWLALRARDGESRGRIGWAFLAGAGVAVLALLKTTLILYVAIPLAIVAGAPKGGRVKPAAALFAGIGALLGAVALGFAVRGAFGDLVDVYAAQSAYAGASGEFGWPRFQRIVFGLFEFYPYLYIGTGLCLVGMALVREARRHPFLWVWHLAFWVQVVVQNKYLEYHFVPLILPVALGLGLVFGALSEWAQESRSELGAMAAKWGVAGVLAFAVVREASTFIVPVKVLSGGVSKEWHDRLFNYNYYSYATSKHVGATVQSLTKPGDRILVYAFNPTIYLYSGRRSVSRHMSNAPIRLEGWFSEGMRRRFFAELEQDVRQNPPPVLVTDFQTDWGIEEPNPPRAGVLLFFGIEYRMVEGAGPYAVFRRAE